MLYRTRLAAGWARSNGRNARCGECTGKVKRRMGFRDTRMPVSTVFENLEDGATVDEITVRIPGHVNNHSGAK
jgi:hypothetical protein